MKKLAWLLVGSAILISTAQVAPAKTTPRVEQLAGVTTIRGDHPASVVVRLPKDVEMDTNFAWRRARGPNENVEIEGAGRYVGVVIVPEPYTPERSTGMTMGRFAQCSKAGCTSDRVMNEISVAWPAGPNGRTLKAGLYRITLIADGAPAQVRLRFPGLSGTTLLEPDDTARVDLKTPRDTVLSNGENLWSAADTFDAGKVGFSTTALWVRTNRLQNFSAGLCQLSSLRSPPPETYGPHCTALDQAMGSGFFSLNDTRDDKGYELLAHFGYHDQGTWLPNLDNDRFGLGLWVHSPSEPIERIGATSFFVQTADTWHEGPLAIADA